ncbi:receptor-type guanylate cyclase gcy-28-like [Gigantopelta aegis]|uniref:receptor-type guanylate cyclase gcy-28-like n=1 Tax=Gigantopelta aegis TaxID=1735272 RepID=UPI001B88BAB5|nr:receptor-type guanylate cyclase gcy-28-like [Gigantopelta aegis]
MIKAHEMNFDNGEYVFFNIDLFSSKNDSARPWYRANDTDERNHNARQAYEALMTVTLRKPTSPEYHSFSEEVKRRARRMYKNFTYGEEEVNSFVGAFHDAVILYALALNETLAADGSITDGAAITRRMWNRTFEGITGTVSIDSNGDRNADYSLLDLNPATDQFEVVETISETKQEVSSRSQVGPSTLGRGGDRTTPASDRPSQCRFRS